MSDIKISELPVATYVSSSDVVPIVQSGTTKQATIGLMGIRCIDLGILDLRDAAIDGRTRTLIPYADGRLISSIRFVPGGVLGDFDGPVHVFFATPNTSTSGFAGFSGASFDTLGIITQGEQTSFPIPDNPANNQILDCGPLFAAVEGPEELGGGSLTGYLHGLPAWQANTPYCFEAPNDSPPLNHGGDSILDNNGRMQQVQVTGGVSGNSEPVWDTNFGTTIDGSLTWQDFGPVPSGTVHLIAEVVEGVSPMPPYPASMEFVAQPVNTAAGATIPVITVIIKDQNSNPYTFKGLFIHLSIYGSGTLAGDSQIATNTATGIATFTGLSITEPGNGYILRARLTFETLAPIFSHTFNIT